MTIIPILFLIFLTGDVFGFGGRSCPVPPPYGSVFCPRGYICCNDGSPTSCPYNWTCCGSGDDAFCTTWSSCSRREIAIASARGDIPIEPRKRCRPRGRRG